MAIIESVTNDVCKINFTDNKTATVNFIDGSFCPGKTMAVIARGYKGIYSPDAPDQTEIDELLKDVNSTKLQTPYEMTQFVFLLRGVSRAFTHQLVRTRHAAYVQESMRFLGHKNVYEILVSSKTRKDNASYQLYKGSCIVSISSYEQMIRSGLPSEDARGVLPTNILTSVFVGLPLSSLQKMYTQRLCCQAQEEWYHVVKKIKLSLVEEYGDEAHSWLSAPVERGEECGYHASFDRPCKWHGGIEKDDNSSM